MITIDRQVRSLAYLASTRAYTSDIRKGKHCAIVFDKRYNIVASFINSGRVHAEQGAVAMLEKHQKNEEGDYTLLVVRAMRSTCQLNMSKPCEECDTTIRNCSSIKRVIFSQAHGKYGFISIN